MFGKDWKATDAKLSATMTQQQEQWKNRERMNWTIGVPVGGSMPFTGWWEKYAATHPDWFAKPPAGITQAGGKGVKLNLSNPEVQEQIFTQWQQQWRKNPQAAKYFKISPNDSRGFDTRPETRAWDAPEMSKYSDQEIWNSSEPVLSDRYVKFWNILARRAGEIAPETLIVALAYRNYRKPPLKEMVDEKVLLTYVGGEGYYPDEPYIVTEWQQWSQKGARKKLWRPNLLQCGHGIPYLFSRQLFNDFQQLQHDGLQGTDFDSLKANWAGQGLNYYILAEQHFRPEATYDELANEYFQAFGPAAAAMKKYHAYFEEVTTRAPDLMREHKLVPYETWGGWWQAHIRLIPLLLTPPVLSQAEVLLKQAESAATDEVSQKRVAFIRRGFDHSRIMADTFRKINFGSSRHVDYAAQRDVLQPLWEARQQLKGDFAVPVDALFYQEQRSFGLWDGFIKKQGEQASARYPLDSGWLIKADAPDVGLKNHWEKNPFISEEWAATTVGVPWREKNSKLESTPGAVKVVWYRNQFELPILEDTAGRVLLRFDAVDAEAHIWVNGILVAERSYPHQGNYDSWKEPFEVNIKEVVKQGPDNVLIVRVRSEQKGAGINGKVFLITQH